jgi:hypothetical protein
VLALGTEVAFGGDVQEQRGATDRLLPGPDGLVRIALEKPFSDGTVAVDLDVDVAALPPRRARP